MKKIKNLIFSIISLIIFSPAFSQEKATIKIGGAFALTGVAQAWGDGELKGARLAIDEFNNAGGVNGVPVEIVVEDTESTNAKTLGAVNKLVNLHGLKVIIGATWLDSYSSSLPFSKYKHVLMITPSAGMEVFESNPHLHDLIFTTWYSTDKEIDKMLEYLKKQKVPKICSIFDQDPFFQMVKQHFEKKVLDLGFVSYPEDSPTINNADYRAVLLKLSKRDCDVVITGITGDSACNSFYKQYIELKVGKPVYGFHDLEAYVKNPNFQGILENIIYVRPVVVDTGFSAKYQAKYGVNPEASSSNSYDATNVILKALKAGKRTPDEISDYLRNTVFDTTTFGKAKFTDKRNFDAGEFEVNKIVNGKPKRID